MKIWELIFIVFLLFIASACDEEEGLTLSPIPETKSEVILWGTTVDSLRDSTIYFSLNVSITDNTYTALGFNDHDLTLKEFPYFNSDMIFYLDFDEYEYAKTGLYYASPNQISRQFSSLLLIDQSLNYNELDQNNLRTEAFNYLIQHISSNNEIQIGFSKRVGLTTRISYISSDFSNGLTENKGYLLDLSIDTGGQTSIYKAIYDALDFVAKNATNEYKSITVLAGKNDDFQSPDADTIIDKANNLNVRINVIWLVHPPYPVFIDTELLSVIPQKTGGFSVLSNNIEEASSAIINLDNLLSENYGFYLITGSLKKGSNWLEGDQFIDYMSIGDGPLMWYNGLPYNTIFYMIDNE